MVSVTPAANSPRGPPCPPDCRDTYYHTLEEARDKEVKMPAKQILCYVSPFLDSEW